MDTESAQVVLKEEFVEPIKDDMDLSDNASTESEDESNGSYVTPTENSESDDLGKKSKDVIDIPHKERIILEDDYVDCQCKCLLM